jgi:hypothetical protein
MQPGNSSHGVCDALGAPVFICVICGQESLACFSASSASAGRCEASCRPRAKSCFQQARSGKCKHGNMVGFVFFVTLWGNPCFPSLTHRKMFPHPDPLGTLPGPRCWTLSIGIWDAAEAAVIPLHGIVPQNQGPIGVADSGVKPRPRNGFCLRNIAQNMQNIIVIPAKAGTQELQSTLASPGSPRSRG